MNTIRLYWAYFRNLLGTALLLAPIILAVWVFQLALRGGSGWILSTCGALAVLLLFRRHWRLWAVFFPAAFRWLRPILSDLWTLARRRVQAGWQRIHTDWNDLRRTLKR